MLSMLSLLFNKKYYHVPSVFLTFFTIKIGRNHEVDFLLCYIITLFFIKGYKNTWKKCLSIVIKELLLTSTSLNLLTNLMVNNLSKFSSLRSSKGYIKTYLIIQGEMSRHNEICFHEGLLDYLLTIGSISDS